MALIKRWFEIFFIMNRFCLIKNLFGKIKKVYLLIFFGCPSSSIPTYLTDWFSAHIRSDNLQLPYTCKLGVIWNQTISNLLVYNLQLPYKYDDDRLLGLFQQVSDSWQDRQDRQNWECLSQIIPYLDNMIWKIIEKRTNGID